MPAARPTWKGHMRLSLVSFAVALYPAISSSAKLSFRQIHKESGQPIREKKVVPGRDGDGEGDEAPAEEVTKDEIVKGYEYQKGRYVILTDEDFEKVRLDTRKAVEMTSFVNLADIDPLYFDRPYYVVPDGDVAEEAFVVVREAMRREGMAALGRVVMSGRERLVAVTVRDKGFLLFTLHPAKAVRSARRMFADLDEEPAVDPEEIEVAATLIARKKGEFDASKFVDRYQEALQQIIDQKLAGAEPEVVQPTRPGNVVNLMDALKRSLGEAAEPEEEAPPPKAKPKTSRKPRGRKEA